MKTLDLSAVQVWFDETSFSRDTFSSRMNDYVSRASSLWRGEHHLVVFPEFYPTFLYPAFKKIAITVSAGKTLINYAVKNLGLSLNPFRKAFLNDALEIEAYYRETFGTIAVRSGAYLLAPSILLPEIEFESARGFFIRDARLYNMAYLFSPSGKVISRSAKHNLTPAESRIIFSRGETFDNSLMTEFGRIGVAICYDMFFETEMEKLDSRGCQIILVPSCNFASWKGSMRGSTQERIWYGDGPLRALKGRENARFLVNAMATGRIGREIAQGRSSIWYAGRALAVSRYYDREDIINTTIEPGL